MKINRTKNLISGSISIDQIINIYGTYNDVLGGSAPYALYATKQKSSSIVGVIGTDFADHHFQDLKNQSQNMDNVSVFEGTTFCWGGKYASDFSYRETNYVRPGISDDHFPKVCESDLSPEFLLLGNCSPHLQLDLLNQIKSEPFIILDTFKLYIETTNKDLKKVIPHADILSINLNEARALSGISKGSVQEMGKIILDLGCKSLIIKQAENGAFYISEKESFSIPSYPVKKLIDPTGAGDSFAGGMLDALSQGKPLIESMCWGSTIASFCIESVGIEGLKNLEEEKIQERMLFFEGLLS